MNEVPLNKIIGNFVNYNYLLGTSFILRENKLRSKNFRKIKLYTLTKFPK